jgi:RNA polymerase sigma-70 factor (ECF subfamily)
MSNEHGEFQTTQWSLVARAGNVDREVRRKALNDLLQRYMPALRTHLIRHRRLQAHDAEDVLQGFLASKVLEKGILDRAEKEKGKFRNFLQVAINRYVASEARKHGAQKRSPGVGNLASMAEDEGLARDCETPDREFDVAWAREVIQQAITKMKEECTASARSDVWGVFDLRVLKPMLDGAEPVSYDAMLGQFGFASPQAASNVLITGKRMFARCLRNVIAAYESEDADIDQEIADLQRILAESRS